MDLGSCLERVGWGVRGRCGREDGRNHSCLGKEDGEDTKKHEAEQFQTLS